MPGSYGASGVVVGEKGVTVVDVVRQVISDEWVLTGEEKVVVRDVGRSADDRSAVVLTAAGARGISTNGKLLPMVEGTKDVVDYVYLGK